MVPYAHNVVVCVVKGPGGEGGKPLISMGPLPLFSSGFLREIDTQSGSVDQHSSFVCNEEVVRKPLITMGLSESCFPLLI